MPFSSTTTSNTTTKTKQNVPNDKPSLKYYTLNGIGERSKVTSTTDTGHTLTTDLPSKMGGSDSAPQPIEILLAAWMGCTQATALFVGRQMTGGKRVVIKRLVFENVRAVRDERGALELPIETNPSVESRLKSISGVVRVFSRGEFGLSLEQIELLKAQTEVRCPVANMILASGCSIDVEWIDGSER